MAFVAAATIGAGVLGAGASIYGANKASQAQSDAAAQAAAIQREQMRQTQSNAQPFITNGQNANNMLASFYGTGGDPRLVKAHWSASTSPRIISLRSGLAAMRWTIPPLRAGA
jgi:hypothetical protein